MTSKITPSIFSILLQTKTGLFYILPSLYVSKNHYNNPIISFSFLKFAVTLIININKHK